MAPRPTVVECARWSAWRRRCWWASASGGCRPAFAPIYTAQNTDEGKYDYWSANAEPYRQATTEYLGQTVALLASLPAAARDGQPDARFVTQAGELLSTTRLLLDSPAAASDPRLKNLLEDLELVLAQLSRLPAEHGDRAQSDH
jgi:hypothetical protein